MTFRLSPTGGISHLGYNTQPQNGGPPPQEVSAPSQTDADPQRCTGPTRHHPRAKAGPKKTPTPTRIQQQIVKMHRRPTGCLTFLLSSFMHFLTLFSKFFSSFPHGTFSLSVSRSYLALDEVYHPFRAAIPNNSTLGKRVVRGRLWTTDGDLTLYVALFQRT